MTADDRRRTFRKLHRAGTFVMPNPFDVGSARILAALGFPALATTSAGFAASLGRLDMSVTRGELVDHVAQLAAATELPLNVDAERCFADDLAGVAETVRSIAAAGAAGCSIEDWDPAAARIDDIEVAVARIAAAAAAAHESDMVLTARCEHHLHGVDDLDATIRRLVAYRDAGADVVYAPGLVDPGTIRRVVDEVGAPLNVLLLPGGPSVTELGVLGVRRVSVGSSISSAAYATVVEVGRRLADDGVVDGRPRSDRAVIERAFGSR